MQFPPYRTYRLEGREVFANTIETPNADGSSNISLGFVVCEINPWISEPQAVVDLLNAGERALSEMAKKADHPTVSDGVDNG